MQRPLLTGILKEELEDQLLEAGQKKYRATQILEWIYKRQATSIEGMNNLPAELRAQLEEKFELGLPEVVRVQGSHDTTQKFLFRLRDGRLVESVLIPANLTDEGERADRRTLCVSSQVGCAYACKFCASGLAGFTRNLEAGEIVSQVLRAEEHTGHTVNNIVFMGMGEPLANLTNLKRAIEILHAHWGCNIGARRMTVSTSGLAPQIKKLADHEVNVRLAISFHGATNEVRDQIMPVNKKYPIEELVDSLQYWQSKRKQKITLEYILIEGINSSLEDAKFLARRCKELGAKANLIPYNTVEGLPWVRPSEEDQDAFLDAMHDAGAFATIRREKGHDIEAACGQLRLQQEVDEGTIKAEV